MCEVVHKSYAPSHVRICRLRYSLAVHHSLVLLGAERVCRLAWKDLEGTPLERLGLVRCAGIHSLSGHREHRVSARALVGDADSLDPSVGNGLDTSPNRALGHSALANQDAVTFA